MVGHSQLGTGMLRDKILDDKSMYIPNYDTQNFPFEIKISGEA